jgi:hypothetical protein
VSKYVSSTTYVSEPLGIVGEPYAETRAALMLKDGLLALKRDKRRSGRDVAKSLGYKQSVVLSHMASGRVPIPLERAEAIANEVEISASEFFLAAVEQRCASARRLLSDSSDIKADQSFSFTSELEELAGLRIENLSSEHKAVMREVVADPRPARRWLSVQEVALVGRWRTAWLRDAKIREDLLSAIQHLVGDTH